ncbi:hypothetical protein J2Z48_001122 [Croceifilum oryzae]|uniref:Uncharacterized protein n=1 Tax=Croceifilum oryzae TaxID=1553429 RepID=A0AAJ1WRU6_9BACL|nr:hypothetical protein [Croceifilum oryzae]MDQ0416950.1 hypothetical protein [Croceifilum oryzae]
MCTRYHQLNESHNVIAVAEKLGVIEIFDKKVLFLSKTTAEALNKKGLVNTVRRVDGPVELKIEKFITLPVVPTGKGIL